MTNIAVVVLDTLRKDAFDRHFDWLPGRRYENAWSPSHWTIPVHGAMFSGQYPSEAGTTAKSEQLDYEGTVLAEHLDKAGYTTRAFSANPYISPVFGYDRGFDEFTGSWRLRHLDPALFDWNRFISETRDEGPTRYLRAIVRCIREDCETLPSLKQGLQLKLRELNLFDDVNDDGASEALKYVQDTNFGSDEFLYVNLMEAHTPYDPPEDYTNVELTHGLGLTETISSEHAEAIDVEAVKQAYDDCVRYLADMYEKIFTELTDDFDYIITLSDHGELLGEHGGWAHGYGLYPELTNVPLTVYTPDTTATEMSDELRSLLDVHATVLETAGIECDTRGHSLFSDGPTDACLTEYHGLTHRRLEKLRDDGVSDAVLTQYDQILRGIALDSYYGFETPDEFIDTGESDGIDGRERLESSVSSLDVSETENVEEALSDDVLNQLEDLGYA